MRFPDRETVERLRREYPAGTVVELISMNDSKSPKPGTKGRVLFVDDVATVHVAWQTGSSLGAAYGEDVIRKVCPICGKPYTDPPALSRTDNKTLICSDCGVHQALEVAGIDSETQEEILKATHERND